MALVQSEEEPTFANLVAQARRGSPVALGEICDRLRQYLTLMALDETSRELHCRVRGSDIVQETLLEACRDFGSFRGHAEQEFRAWLFTVLRRTIIDASRRYQKSKCRDLRCERPLESIAEPVANVASASTILQRREIDEQLLQAVTQLPDRHRQVIELRHLRGLRFSQIADAMNISEDAARQLWTRAVESLRRVLAGSYGYPLRPR